MRQIGPWSAEPLAAVLEWRLKELEARILALESRLEVCEAAQAAAVDEESRISAS